MKICLDKMYIMIYICIYKAAGMFPRKKKDGLKMISKNQRQLILNLIEKYGDLRETYGRNSKNLLDFEKEELNKEIGTLFGSIGTHLICSK